MSCECMKKLTTMVVETQPFTGLKITEAKFDQVLAHVGDSFIFKPVLEIELTCEGRVKPVRKEVAYTFCPFCGLEYNSKKEEVTNG